MNRTKFFKKVRVRGIDEVDFLWNTLSAFKKNHISSYYRISGEEVGQPDLVSWRVYGTERYWWIICLANQIENPLEDMEEGSILEIPNIHDIYDFYQTVGVR